MPKKEKAGPSEEDVRIDGDSISATFFAHDLTAYAGEWVAADEHGIVAHRASLRELRRLVSSMTGVGPVRYYAVPGEIQIT